MITILSFHGLTFSAYGSPDILKDPGRVSGFPRSLCDACNQILNAVNLGVIHHRLDMPPEEVVMVGSVIERPMHPTTTPDPLLTKCGV
ncbi:hypothetical protein TNCV_3880911 [Trichonephila clavipes]|nr:hypothetical protein TNCV_3880911 [Trichonephila clavipes]